MIFIESEVVVAHYVVYMNDAVLARLQGFQSRGYFILLV